MSDLNLVVGQTATSALTFSETAAPSDGAIASDNPAILTASLAADRVTWTCVAVSGNADGSPAVVTVSYTGTSVAPDVGAAVVPPMTFTVTPAPMAETGSFNPSSATISSGP
jgi:hypothetical protein